MLPELVKEILASSAGIEVNGSSPWDIQVKDDRWYARVWNDKSLGLGESYMDGWWDCERLDEMFCRLLRADVEGKVRSNLRYLLRQAPGVIFNLQSRPRARIVAERHYDLGNDLFTSFLDPYLQYRCGYFKDTDDLEQAQLNKLALLTHKLNLDAGDRVLDIGCGWGGLARYIAERYGCAVTAVNISREQLGFARDSCKNLPVSFVDRDYRAMDGKFDKIVSVGMFEHVGSKNYREFMRVARQCLEDTGVFVLHTIGSNTSGRGGLDPWFARYIFPNGMLPSIAQIARATKKLFVIEDWHNLGPHYDQTLMAWNERFQRAWPKLSRTYDQRFKRMWEYYLLSCAGAFRARYLQLWQIVMTGHNTGVAQPICRADPGELDTPRRVERGQLRVCCG